MISNVKTESSYPHSVPRDWKRCRVKDALDFYNTRRIPLSAAVRGAMTEKIYDYYGASGIIDRVEDYLFDGTYILLAEDGANLLSRTKTLAFLATGKFWVNNHAHILRPHGRGNSRYFVNLLESLDYSLFVTGAAQPKLTMENLGRCGLTVPTPSQQERITAYLDASCTAIDAAVAAKRCQLETLDGLRRFIIQQTVTRGLGDVPTLRPTNSVWIAEIPEGWHLVSLKRLCETHTGLTLGKTYTGPLIERPYLRVANVQDGHVDLSDVTMIEVPEYVARGVELRAGDVLMTEGGDLDKLGRGTVWNGEIPGCLHQNHIFAIRCFRHKLSSAFLAYLTASQYGRDYFEATGKRTTNLASTNSTKVGLFPIPLPTLKVQDAICRFLDEKLSDVQRIKSGIETQITTLIAYRKSLIHECITGQRRISEADVRRVRQGSGPNQVHLVEANV